MIKKAGIYLILSLVLLSGAVMPYLNTTAQTPACSETIRTILQTTKEVCDSTRRNQACYGNDSIEAQPKAGITDLVFQQRGDLADLRQVQAFQLSGSQEADWGVALLRLQANIPDEMPQNVTMLIFGNVELGDASTTGNMQAVTLQTGVDDATCENMPSSGMMIQTPDGVGEVKMLVNQVVIDVGSTVYFGSMQPGQMTVKVLEGRAILARNGQRQIVPAGTQTYVPVDEDFNPIGDIPEPEPYEDEVLDTFEDVLETMPEDAPIMDPPDEAELELILDFYAGDLDFESLSPEEEAFFLDYFFAEEDWENLSDDEILQRLDELETQVDDLYTSSENDSWVEEMWLGTPEAPLEPEPEATLELPDGGDDDDGGGGDDGGGEGSGLFPESTMPAEPPPPDPFPTSDPGQS